MSNTQVPLPPEASFELAAPAAVAPAGPTGHVAAVSASTCWGTIHKFDKLYKVSKSTGLSASTKALLSQPRT